MTAHAVLPLSPNATVITEAFINSLLESLKETFINLCFRLQHVDQQFNREQNIRSLLIVSNEKNQTFFINSRGMGDKDTNLGCLQNESYL